MDDILQQLLKGEGDRSWLVLVALIWALYQGLRSGVRLLGEGGLKYLFDEKTGKLTGLINFHADTMVEGKKMVEVVTLNSQASAQHFADLKQQFSESHPLIKKVQDDVSKVFEMVKTCPSSEIGLATLELLIDLEDHLDIPQEVKSEHKNKLAALKVLVPAK